MNKNNHRFKSADIIKRARISLRQLYYWELKGIIKPELVKMGTRQFKRYSEKDIVLLKKIKLFLAEGYTLESAVKKINQWEV